MSDESRDLLIERLERRLMNKENELSDFYRNVSDLESRVFNLELEISKLYELFNEYLEKAPEEETSERWSKENTSTKFNGEVIIAEDSYVDPFTSKYGDKGQIIIAEENKRASIYNKRICRENEDIIITAS